MSSSERVDAIVVGDGLVGVASARALSRRGISVALVGTRAPGFASPAAAGFLAPTIEAAEGGIFEFALGARERYRSFIAELKEESGRDVPLDFAGILRIPTSDDDIPRLARELSTYARWLSAQDVAEIEPALEAPLGALLHHDDGLVDNEALLSALDLAVDRANIRRIARRVTSLFVAGDTAEVTLDDGGHLSAGALVLAAGAWSATLPGLPHPLPVAPVRGQMLVIAGAPLRRPVYAAGGYLASRGHLGFTMVGSTYERVGFRPGTIEADLDRFEHIARTVVPRHPFARQRAWSGLRPVTPDFHPILGRDPEHPALIYACGHSRNGILMAPLTGDVVAELVGGRQPSYDLSPFSVTRFANGNGENSNP